MIPILEYIPVIAILCYIPFVCISDWKTRHVNFLYFTPLIVACAPSFYNYVIESPARNYWLFGLTVILCCILLALAVVGAIGGADFWFASFIMLFVQYNPFVFPRVFFALDFFWTLLLITICLPIPIYFYNKAHRNDMFDDVTQKEGYGVIAMFTKVPHGVPFMIPISFAFVATLVMEMV